MASNVSGGKCIKCGKPLKNGIKYGSNGKFYCYDCYQGVATKIQQEQSEKEKIYSYIKKIFKVSSLSEYLIDGINRLLEDNKTEDGILYSLYYIYEIKGNELEINYIIPNIKRFYQEAKEYYELQLKVEEANKNINIKSEVVTVKIKKSDLDADSKPKFSYNMEDL